MLKQKANCEICGKSFEYYSSRIKGKKGKYCSRQCYYVSLKGRTKSDEWKRKIKESGKNFGPRPWAIFNLKPVGFGENNPFYGKHHSLETKAKLRESRLKQRFAHVSQIEFKIRNKLKEEGIKFEFQKVITGICEADIFIPPNLVIFCDGDYWHNLPQNKERDLRQNKKLKEQGYKVLRFWEHEINKLITNCINQIKLTLNLSVTLKIYIAGPLNAPDAAGYLRNVSKMLWVANEIRRRGHAVYVPAFDLLLGIVDGGMTREDFLDFNLPWVEVCDALFLTGMSDGVRRELALAEKLGKTVYTHLREVPLSGQNQHSLKGAN